MHVQSDTGAMATALQTFERFDELDEVGKEARQHFRIQLPGVGPWMGLRAAVDLHLEVDDGARMGQSPHRHRLFELAPEVAPRSGRRRARQVDHLS